MNRHHLIQTTTAIILLTSTFFIMLLVIKGEPPMPDGLVFVTSDNEVATQRASLGHYGVQGFCRFAKQNNLTCEDDFVGCGAINCICFDVDPSALDAVIYDWVSNHECHWESGKGMLCT